MEPSQAVWLVVDLIKSSSQAAPHVQLQLSKPLPTSSACESSCRAGSKTAKQKVFTNKCSLHLWLRTCWSDSCWRQADTRAVLNLSKGNQHPKETPPRDNAPQVTWRMTRTLRETTPVFNGHQSHHTAEATEAPRHMIKTHLCPCLITWLATEACSWRDGEIPAARWDLGTLHYSMLHPRTVMWQNLITPLRVYLFIMHWMWKTIQSLFQLYCILPVHFEGRLKVLLSWFLPPQQPCLFSWLPPLLFLAPANDNKLLICLQMTFTAESRKLHQRKW